MVSIFLLAKLIPSTLAFAIIKKNIIIVVILFELLLSLEKELLLLKLDLLLSLLLSKVL